MDDYGELIYENGKMVFHLDESKREEYEEKKEEIVSAIVLRVDPVTGNATVEIGKNEMMLYKNEQINGETLNVGTPYVEGATVVAKVIKNGKAKKITVFKYKAKKNEKKKIGHRQPFTKVQIVKIEG